MLAEILYECGANIFVRTNVPQTLIASGSSLILVDLCLQCRSFSGARHIIMYLEGPLIHIIDNARLEDPLEERVPCLL